MADILNLQDYEQYFKPKTRGQGISDYLSMGYSASDPTAQSMLSEKMNELSRSRSNALDSYRQSALSRLGAINRSRQANEQARQQMISEALASQYKPSENLYSASGGEITGTGLPSISTESQSSGNIEGFFGRPQEDMTGLKKMPDATTPIRNIQKYSSSLPVKPNISSYKSPSERLKEEANLIESMSGVNKAFRKRRVIGTQLANSGDNIYG